VLTRYASDEKVAENVCKCYANSIENFGVSLESLLNTFLQKFGTCFANTHLSCYIWVARKCVKLFAAQPDKWEVMLQFAEALSAITFKKIESSQLQDIPDVVEEYFRLMLTLESGRPLALLQSPLFIPSFQCAISCLAIPEVHAVESVLDYMRDSLLLGKTSGHGNNSHEPSPAAVMLVHQLILQLGPVLVKTLIAAMFQTMPTDAVPFAANLIVLLAELDATACINWVKLGVISDIPSAIVPDETKAKFVAEYEQAIGQADWLQARRVLVELATLFRRRRVRV